MDIFLKKAVRFATYFGVFVFAAIVSFFVGRGSDGTTDSNLIQEVSADAPYSSPYGTPYSSPSGKDGGCWWCDSGSDGDDGGCDGGDGCDGY